MADASARTVVLLKSLAEKYAATESEYTAQLKSEFDECFERYKQEEVQRVQSLLSSDRAVDLRSVELWRTPKLVGFIGFGSTVADLAEPGTWWTSAGLRVQKQARLARPPHKLRKYLVRIRHFRGSASFGASRTSGNAGGAPLVAVSSIDEDDAIEEHAEEGVPPAQALGAEPEAPVAKSTLNQVEVLSGVDIDGDGDVGLGHTEAVQRPVRKRVWDGTGWATDWEYVHGDSGRSKHAGWTTVHLESASSESICLEVCDPDLLSDADGGRVGVAMMAASVGYGWQPVYDRSHSVIGQVYVEIMKKKKKPKEHVPLEPASKPSQAKFVFVPDSKNGLGIRLSDAAIIGGYSEQEGAAEKAGVPVGSHVREINGVVVTSKADALRELERENSKAGSRWELEWICELPVDDAAAEDALEELSEVDPASAPAEFIVHVGSYYDFKQELKAFEMLMEMFTARVDAVVLGADLMHEVAIGLMTRGFHAAVERAIIQRWGPSGVNELEPMQFGDVLAFIKSYLDFMSHLGWTPTPEFVGVISKGLFGETAEKICHIVGM
jgi:hypothetical protein